MQNMKRIGSVLLVLLVCSMFCVGTVAQQVMKTPVSVSRTGNDEVGSLLVAAINQELSKSTKYEGMRDEPVPHSAKLGIKASAAPKKGLEFFIELVTADVAPSEQARGITSAISFVTESMGLPKQLAGSLYVVPQDRDYKPRNDQYNRQTVRRRYGCSRVQHDYELDWRMPRRTMEVGEVALYPGLSVTTFPSVPGNFAFTPPATSPANSASKLGYA
jgi:hypothetical protein